MVSAAVTLRVFRVPVKAPLSCLVKVPSVIAMTCTPLLWLIRKDRPCDVSRSETARGAAVTASLRSGRSAAEDLDGGKICSAAAARKAGLLIRPGKFFCRTGWQRCPRALALKETCRGRYLQETGERRPLAYPLGTTAPGLMAGRPA